MVNGLTYLDALDGTNVAKALLRPKPRTWRLQLTRYYRNDTALDAYVAKTLRKIRVRSLGPVLGGRSAALGHVPGDRPDPRTGAQVILFDAVNAAFGASMESVYAVSGVPAIGPVPATPPQLHKASTDRLLGAYDSLVAASGPIWAWMPSAKSHAV